MIYYLYRLVNEGYILWGKYTTPESLANAAFHLGKLGVKRIRIEVKNAE